MSKNIDQLIETIEASPSTYQTEYDQEKVLKILHSKYGINGITSWEYRGENIPKFLEYITFNEGGIYLMPIIIVNQVEKIQKGHWVGLVIKNIGGTKKGYFVDTANNEKIAQACLEWLNQEFGAANFIKIKVSPQNNNNDCGPLIVEYLLQMAKILASKDDIDIDDIKTIDVEDIRKEHAKIVEEVINIEPFFSEPSIINDSSDKLSDSIVEERQEEVIANHDNSLLFSREGHIRIVEFIQKQKVIGQIDRNALPDLYSRTKSWKNIPNFAVITGQNGVGKSLLLKYIDNNLVGVRGAFNSQFSKINQDEVLYIGPDYDISRISSIDGGKSVVYELSDEKRFRANVEKVLDAIKSDSDIIAAEAPFAAKVAKNVKIELGRGLEKSAITKGIIEEIARRTVNYELNELKLKEPVTFISYIIYCNNQQKKVIREQVKEVTGALTLYDYQLKDSVIISNGDVSFTKEQDLRKFFERISSESSFKEAVIDSYVNAIIGPSPLDNMNEVLKQQGFKYRLIYKDSKYSNEIIKIKVGDRELPVSSLSSGERTVLSILTWQFAVNGLSNTGKEEDKQLNKKIKIMLFDELDAHLDPELCRLFYKIVYEEFVQQQNIQVIMTTHRMDTLALAPDDSIFTIKSIDGYPEIIKVPKLRAMFRMAGNIRDLVDYHQKVYAESVDDARFYEGVYSSLKALSDKVRERRKLEDSNDYYWYINEGKAETPFRLLSNRYQISFYSVSEKKEHGSKGDGGCKKIQQFVNTDMNAYENLFKGEAINITSAEERTNVEVASTHWRKTRKILNDRALYTTFGIIDNDYGSNLYLSKEKNYVVPKQRHSIENFIFDPIVFCSVLTEEEIRLVISDSHIKKNADLMSDFIGVCLGIKGCLELIKENKYNLKELQSHLNKFFKVVMETVYNNAIKNSEIKAKSKEICGNIKRKLDSNQIISDNEVNNITYILDEDTNFTVNYPNELLELRGHDIGEQFFRKNNEYKPVNIIANRIFYKGLSIIPLDLAEVMFELNKKVRNNAREVLRPGEKEPINKKEAEAATVNIQRVWRGHKGRSFVKKIKEERESKGVGR